VIHVATHGFVVEDSCAVATAGARGVGGVAPVDAPVAPAAATPSPWLGRRVLLVLAGANEAGTRARDEDEGFLTAEEVSTLDLRGTDWVVLSACRSGIGDVWRGEGLLGMRRAFRIAGARTVIASQWDVNDDATTAWMEALHVARMDGARGGAAPSAADCARRASCTVLDQRRRDGLSTHPFYWAAFTGG